MTFTQDYESNGYSITLIPGDITRVTGSICCAKSPEGRREYVYGTINEIYSVNGELVDTFTGRIIRNGEYIFGSKIK